jgi:Tfp pilus assembly protein PilX
LFIALIVLVAMGLAAAALTRSVDTGTVVAGNLAFKQSSIQGADRGVDAATAWLLANAAGAALDKNLSSQGYYSSRPAAEPDWFDPEVWTELEAVTLPEDASGNSISYVIHRMCTQPDTAYNGSKAGVPNECALSYSEGGANPGASKSVGNTVFAGTPKVHYRVTSRTAGPRNTFSVVQTHVVVTN